MDLVEGMFVAKDIRKSDGALLLAAGTCLSEPYIRLLNQRKVSAEGQYHITARWTIQVAGKPEARDLYVILRSKNDHWSVVSVRSASQ